MILAQPDSSHVRRCEFGAHPIWVTRYADGELYAAGKHTNHSLGGEGINSWIQKKHKAKKTSNVKTEDIVVWHTFGTTHNPLVEDWPVMPSEKMTVSLKPVNFFEHNPGIDFKASNQKDNRGELVSGEAWCSSPDMSDMSDMSDRVA
jgi:primary-amine oxidase